MGNNNNKCDRLIRHKEVYGKSNSPLVSDVNRWCVREMNNFWKSIWQKTFLMLMKQERFFQLLPERNLAFKGEKCNGGKKSKQR